jgi:hypothetical protein
MLCLYIFYIIFLTNTAFFTYFDSNEKQYEYRVGFLQNANFQVSSETLKWPVIYMVCLDCQRVRFQASYVV